MAHWGRTDFEQLKQLQKQLQKFQRIDMDVFCEQCAKDLAGQLLRKVKQKTPVKSGNLRNNWMIGEVVKQGDLYVIEVINPTEYASYVEYGHRTHNHRGFLDGKFMLTLSEEELKREAPKILEQKLKKKLIEVFHDQ